MWTKRASGKSFSSVAMRAVCGGDFSTSRRPGWASCSRRMNHRKPSSQRRRSDRQPEGRGCEKRGRSVAREGQRRVGRGQADLGQRELVLERLGAAHRHCVHRPWSSAGTATATHHSAAFGNQKAVGKHAFEGRREGRRGIERQEIVQEARAASPMAEHEERRHDLDRLGAAAKELPPRDRTWPTRAAPSA